jgi:hypothetical protein
VRVRVGAVAFSLSFLFLATTPGFAETAAPAPPQAPLPASGFMTPHEITRIVRSAGFDPLAPPLREGSTYVLRATDFRGILMRVVVDAHSGAIRAVNRIVAGPGPIGPIGMMPPPYGVMPPYGSAGFEGPEMAPDEPSEPAVLPPAALAVVHPAVFPPLPRPRPAELVAHKAAIDAAPATTSAVKSDPKPDIAPVAPNKPAAPSAPLND